MESNKLIQYTERIYGYAIKKVYSREEADELSQEILFTAIKQLPNLKDEQRFEPWLWGIASNVTKAYRRQKGRERETYVYDSVDTSFYYDEYTFEAEALHKQIRKQIAMLSALYREIIILHYYDNLSCKAIAQQLGIPEGTVTWRLSEGRKKLKKGCTKMIETALRPMKLIIRISGEGNYNGKNIPFPWAFIDDALSQNILYHSYQEARTVEDLATLCGVPAYYIESNLENLLAREAIIESVKGKYRTNFIIYDEKTSKSVDQMQGYGEELKELITSRLKEFTHEAMKLGIYLADKSEEELIYLFGMLACEHLNRTYNPETYTPYPIRYDGHTWSYHAHVQGVTQKGLGIGIDKNLNKGGKGSLSHSIYGVAGFTWRQMMGVDGINLCEKILRGQGLEEDDKEKLAYLIKGGYIKRDEKQNLKVTIPYLTLEQKEQFDQLAETYFQPIMPQMIEAITAYTKGYKKLFPKHLQDDVQRNCNYLFIGLFAGVLRYAQEKEWLLRPQKGSICDILIEFKK
ncbi:MAG: RNA polymerase sigma factor [Cellulosilyticaceae bacterium]